MTRTKTRSGISLMEVLISIGVISLGIFGVASLIPVAQFKVAEGTALDRIAALGPSAASEFRIRNMGSPDNWVKNFASHPIYTQDSDGYAIGTKGVVIDPLGVIQGRQDVFPATAPINQPLEAMPWLMPRINLTSMTTERMAQKVFYFGDDVVFDRPSDVRIAPRRQYFIDPSTRLPIATAPGAQFSWFATLAPTPISEEFLLSIVICKARLPDQRNILQSEYSSVVLPEQVMFPGEIRVENTPWVSELKPGDWLMIAKGTNLPNNAQAKFTWAYRWTQINGTSDEETDKLVKENGLFVRRFSITNDDFLGPNDFDTSQNKAVYIFFAKGVESVFERTIRLKNTTAWVEP